MIKNHSYIVSVIPQYLCKYISLKQLETHPKNNHLILQSPLKLTLQFLVEPLQLLLNILVLVKLQSTLEVGFGIVELS